MIIGGSGVKMTLACRKTDPKVSPKGAFFAVYIEC